ncbi:MAG: OmpA family protein, partial [Cyclobacteriaceae bacterium]
NYLKRKENVFTMEKDVVTEEYNKLQKKNSQETNSKIFPVNFGEQFSVNEQTLSDQEAALEASRRSYSAGLEIAPSATESVTELDRATIDFYQNLSVEDRLKIDRFIAARYINRDYQNATLVNADLDFEKSLSREERSHVKLLSRKLKESTMNNAETDALSQSFVFYNNKATNAKPKWNRLILSYALDINKTGDYLAKRKDYAYYQSLSTQEKNYVSIIEGFRRQNHKILTENLNEDASNVVIPTLTKNIPKYLVKTPQMSIEGELIDNQDGTSVKSFAVALEDQGGQKVYQTSTNENGEFAFRSIETDNYKLVSADDKYAEKFEKDYFIKGLKVESIETSEFNNTTSSVLFFDSDSKALRREGIVLLDEIAREYNNSRFLIELDSHTDSEGNKEYNETLSLSRGNSVKNYLVSKGVDNNDIVLRFYGSDKPVASNDNVYGKQFNRRVNVTMKAGKSFDYNPAVVYLAQPTADFSKLAARYEISEERLMKLNGLNLKNLAPYKPVRLPNTGISPDLSQVVPLNNDVMAFTTYTVGKNETVTSIADKFRIPEELLYELNNLQSDNLTEGTVIIIIKRNR